MDKDKDYLNQSELSEQNASETPSVANNHDYMVNSNRQKPKFRMFGKITAGLLVLLIVMCSFFGGYMVSSMFQSEDSALADWLVEVLNENAYYADYEGLDGAFLMENGLKFCLRDDPYCDLMTPEETKAYYNTANGSSLTFGLSVGEFEGQEGVYVVSVVEGSSADSEGLYAGMRVVSIDGIDLYEKKLTDVTDILLSKQDGDEAEVCCIIPIQNLDGTLTYDLDCEEFTAVIKKMEYTPTVVEYYDNKTKALNLDDNTAYIKITSFTGKTADQFNHAMNWYKETGKTNLILDLRNNAGGSEENMKEVGSYLLKAEDDDKNPLIITIEDKHENSSEIRATASYYDDMAFENVIVLVNSKTASASEAILTAMIDYETVDIIIGEKTFGKGTGLTTVPMPIHGYSVVFTSSVYFSPYGNSHDKIGLNPTNGYAMVDTTNFIYTYDTDMILQRAINALK